MGSRNPEKEMLKNHVAFETYMKLAEAAIKSTKSTVKKLLDLRTKSKVGGVFPLVHSELSLLQN